MRLLIDHRTRYRFSAPQARLVQMLRMTPSDTNDQTVAAWRIDIDCDARLKSARDGFGNLVTMLYAQGPLSGIEIAVRGEVLTTPTNGVVDSVAETFPPALFLRSTALTTADQAMIDFATGDAPTLNQFDQLQSLNRAINARFEICSGRPVAGRTAAEAFVLEKITARDLAHIFVATARMIGAPARYVTGYRLLAASEAIEPTLHGWAEAFATGLGWVAFDPSTGLCATEEYVRVSIGLDAASAAPVAGSRLGVGVEQLDVDVRVERLTTDN